MFGKTLLLETRSDSLAPGYGQRIQAGEVFCDDSSCGVYRVRRDGVLHEARRARAHSGRTAGVLDRRESGRTSAARRKIADARGIEHDGPKVFRAARIGQSVRLESGVRTRLRRRVQEDASVAVNRRDRGTIYVAPT